MNQQSNFYYAYKCWINNDFEFIWQIKKLDVNDKSKYFLVCDLKPQSFGIKVLKQKPQALTSNHAVINLIRKHLPSQVLIMLLQNIKNNDLWIKIYVSKDMHCCFYLHFAKINPPQLQFIDWLGNTLVRYGMAGTYTHKIKYEYSDISEVSEKNPQYCLLDLNGYINCMGEPSQQASVIPQTQKDIIKKLRRKQKTLKKFIAKTKQHLPSYEEVVSLEIKAKYLQQYCYLAQDFDKELVLSSDLTGLDDKLKIELNPNLSIGENINYYFEQLKKQKKAFEINNALLHKTQKELSDLQSLIDRCLNQILDKSEIDDICKKYQLNLSASVSDDKKNVFTTLKNKKNQFNLFKIFKTEEGHLIFVGKDAESNDILTKKCSDNDYWFHIVGDSGSHVVIKFDPKFKSNIPQTLIRQALILAVHFSKFRRQKCGEVYFTQKKYLKKPKGAMPGFWNVLKAQIIFVQYTDDEIKKILLCELKN